MQDKFHAQLSWARKKFYNLGAWTTMHIESSQGFNEILKGEYTSRERALYAWFLLPFSNEEFSSLVYKGEQVLSFKNSSLSERGEHFQVWVISLGKPDILGFL